MVGAAESATQELYAHSSEQVRLSITSLLEARATYADYVGFVRNCANAATGRLLDVGCGNGWSTYMFADAGFDATGVDLNPDAFQARSRSGLHLQHGSALELPFADETFDVVGSYQALEHIPEPERALDELVRVCKSGGMVCIVGPNLVSVSNNMKAILMRAWRTRPAKRIFFRYPDTPRHPTGNTIGEAVCGLFATIGRLVQALGSSRAAFRLREPDRRPPFFADNDACYLCTPSDITRHLRSRGLQVIKNGAWGRPSWTAWAAGGTWIAARKPLSTSRPHPHRYR